MPSLARMAGEGQGERTMKRFVRVLAVAVLAALPLAACGDYSEDIEAVRQDRTVTQDQTNDALALQLAGARGKVEWVADRPDKYADNEFIVAVTAKIERITRAGAKRQIELQFIRNRQNQQISFEQLTIDGQPQGLVGGALNLLLMQLE
jgi:hypothetical protein